MQLENQNMNVILALFPDFQSFSQEEQSLIERSVAHFVNFKDEGSN